MPYLHVPLYTSELFMLIMNLFGENPGILPRRPPPRSRKGLVPLEYGLVILWVALAVVGRSFLDPYLGDSVPYVTFFLSSAVAIRYTGAGPAVAAIILGAVAADYFFMPPRHTFTLTPSQAITSAVFLLANGVMLAMARDMRRAKERAETNAGRMDRSQEIAHLGSWELDLVKNRLSWSDEVYRIFGLQPQEFAATYEAFLDAVYPEDREKVDRAYSESVRDGRGSYEIEHRVIRKRTGEVRIVHERCAHTRDGSGRIVRSVGMVHDITEQKTAEEELQKAKEDLRQHAERLERTVEERTAELQHLVNELEHFSYTVTHDLRSPLRAMQSFSQIVEENSCSDCEHRDFLHRIQVGARRMDTLITDALSYTKTVRSRPELVPIDVEALLCGMLKSYPNLQPPSAEVLLEGHFPLVLGNEAALTQCFSNLLGNAVKFVSPGTKPRVRVRAEEREDAVVRLWFADNGIGIAAAHIPKLFGMFQRLSAKYEGTGIGLALVRKNVEKMGGQVGVESEPGKGSRFWLELKTARR